jgi:hypothetical protein
MADQAVRLEKEEDEVVTMLPLPPQPPSTARLLSDWICLPHNRKFALISVALVLLGIISFASHAAFTASQIGAIAFNAENWPNAAAFGVDRGPIPMSALLAHAAPDGSYVVNVGAREGDPADGDPTISLWLDASLPQWKRAGLAIEGVPSFCGPLSARLNHTNVTVECTFITPASIGELLFLSSVPRMFDLLKIDIDSVDCGVLEGVLKAGYRPRVIHMEINYELPPPIVFAVEYTEAIASSWFWANETFRGFYGCSISRVHEVARYYGYSLVQAFQIDVDLVRDDLLPTSAPTLVTDPMTLYTRGVVPSCSQGANHFGYETGCRGLMAKTPQAALEAVWRHLLAKIPVRELRQVLYRLYLADDRVLDSPSD